MTLNQINEILKGRFTSEDERQYWVDKRDEKIRKMKNAEENKKFYQAMAVYNR